MPFAISAPAQRHKDGRRHEGAADLPSKLSATAPLSLWINRRVIELFCAQVFGIRKGRPFDPQRRLSTIRVINLAGGVSGRTITRLTVERLTPIFRASSFCVAFGFAATSLAIFAQSPPAGGAGPWFCDPPSMQ